MATFDRLLPKALGRPECGDARRLRPEDRYGGREGYALIRDMAAAPPPYLSLRFPRVALIGRQSSPGLAEPLARLAAFLAAGGHDVLIEEETARSTPLPGYRTAPPEALGR